MLILWSDNQLIYFLIRERHVKMDKLVFEKPLKKITLREMLVDRIKELIEEGKLLPGQKLPSERELGIQMNVSRSVVREALMVLSSLDVVESRQGEGTFIKEAISSNFINCNLFGLLIDKEIYLSLFEVRKSIESAIVAKAVERAAEDDFKNFSNNIILLNKHLNANNYLNFITADMGFHKMIAKATHDDILIDLSTNTTGLFMKFWTKMAAINSDDKFNSFRGNVLNQHSNIYKQIQKRNKQEAIKAMEEHMLHEHQAIALGLQELSQNSMPMSWGTVL